MGEQRRSFSELVCAARWAFLLVAGNAVAMNSVFLARVVRCCSPNRVIGGEQTGWSLAALNGVERLSVASGSVV